METITFFNNKGGVGKTTTVVNLASYLSINFDKKILLVDLDPQSNTTQLVIPEDDWELFYGENAIHPTIFNYFTKMDEGHPDLDEVPIHIKSTDNKYGIDLIAGHPNLSIIDDVMSKSWNNTLAQDKGELKKLNWLNQLKFMFNEHYDYMFIDVGPSLGALNRSVLLNTDYFVSPMGSDIFSVIGIENIGAWITRWRKLYKKAIENFEDTYEGFNLEEYSKMHHVNIAPENTSKFLGYSIQQYSKRKFKGGIVRPVQAYETVINKMQGKIVNNFGFLIPDSINEDAIKIGDVPYVYSIVPLSQTSNCPIFKLDYASGLRGNQTSSVQEYTKYIDEIAKNFLRNLGDYDAE